MLSAPGVIPNWATFLFAAGLVVGPLYVWLVELPASVRDREERVHAARYGHKLMLTLVALLLTAGAAHAQGRGSRAPSYNSALMRCVTNSMSGGQGRSHSGC